MDDGFITLHRSVQKHWIWQEPEALKFWMALLLEANWQEKKTMFNGSLLTVKRGELVFGRIKYSRELNISVKKIRRYLDLLERENMITKGQQKSNKFSLISITNYESFQKRASRGPAKGQQNGSERASQEPVMTGDASCSGPAKGQQETQKGATSKQQTNKTIGGKLKRFIPPEISEVQEYCLERKNNINPETFIDFYSATNWMRGKNKVKDWKACVRTWEKNRRESSYSSPANLSSQEYFL
jgi:DNA replication protein DnaD